MSKGKTWQRVASAFLAAVMTFSTFSTTIAYAAEATTDSSITTDAVSDTDAVEEVDATDSAASSSTTEGEVTKPEATEAPAATETPDETDATEPEETPAPTEAPTPTPEPTESPEATAEPEPTEEPEETETPDVSESDFVAVGLADDATEGQIDAEIGDEVTFNAHVNRDDVNLQYQWYKRFIEPQTAEYDEDLMEYDYGGDEPTAYGFLVEGKTPAEVLAENPDAGWSGIELYRAVVSAMEAIGADTSNVNIEFGTRNYALEGFTITATMVDGNVVISADKDNEHATGTLNENNEFAFAESTNNGIAVQPAEVQTEEEVDPDSLEANGWEAIEGATSDTYTHTVDEYDAYTTYRCVITIADDDYIAAAKKALVALGADESKLTDDALDNTFMSEITIHIPSMDASEDDIYNDLSVEDKLKQRLALSGISTYAAGVQLDSQSNPQWVTGLSAGMEYLTADMYAKLYGQDGKGGWLAEGKVTPEQADRYWSKITSSGFSTYAVANELDSEGLPTGATRQYSSFTLTDGKLEINSEWYGKTVYFRYYNPNIVGNTATGTAVSIPAAGRGTSYKDAVQVLFCYVVEENGITLPLTIKEYVTQATHNGYSANGLAHITLNTISANKFNVDPDRYLKDAEGNYRNDSVYWGTCYYSEPDLSGKAYYALKNFIGNGYGFGIGHDTMYAYAGAYFDAYGGGSGYPNVKYTEKNIDPNDTATRYYSVNSYKVNTGHWNMNALMGENNSNTLVGSGYYSASDEEYFGWIVDPLTVPSAIMSSGGSHGPFAKSTIYGNTYVVVDGDAPVVLNAAIVKDPTPPIDVEKDADKYIAKVTDVVTYTITVKNTTDEAVNDITVTDHNNFAGAITAENTERCTYNGDGTWTIGHLDAGETLDIVYTYTVETTDKSVMENTATIKYTHDGEQYEIPSNTVDVEKPDDGVVTIRKAADKTEVEPGETVTYTVTVHNGKNHDIENARLTDANNFAGEIVGIDGAGYTFKDGEFIIDKIAAGADVVIHYTYTAQIADVPTEILENIATIHVPGTNPEDPENPGHGKDPNKPIDPDEDVPSNKVDVKVPGSEVETKVPVIEITKSVDKAEAKVGDTLNYTVTVSNKGKADAENVVIEDFFDGTGTLNFIPMDGVKDNGDNTYTISSVKVGESIELHFTYVVTVSDAPQVLNAAVVKDPTPPIDVEKDADKYVAKVTDVVTYTITVRNTTDETVNDITVSDHNNFSGSIDAVGSDRYTYNGDGTWTIGYLDADEAIDIVYTYTVETTDKSVMENTATIKYTHDGEQYNIPSNTVDVKKPDDGVVTIWKSANKTVAKPGETVTYTVTVHNGKDHDIQNAVLTDENNFSGSIFAVEGAGYHYENGMFTIDTIPAGGDVVVHYAYTVGIADVPTNILENIATIHVPGTNPEDPENPGQGKDPTKPIDPDTDIPSNKVDVEVPGSGTETDIPLEKSLTIVKSADKTKVNVGETINYRVVVTNTGEVDLVNVSVKDNNNGASHIVATSGDGYTYDDATATFTINRIPVGESFTLTYSYVAVDADAGHDVINVAVAKAPGQNPEDPENPGHGKDPSKPIDEDVEKPSNEVKVPVVKPSTPVTPDEPKPTPTPSNPTNPTPTPVPSEKPTNPIQGIVSIITGNKKTGIGFVQGIAGLAAVVGVGLIALVVVNHKRKKDTDNDEDKHNNESAE